MSQISYPTPPINWPGIGLWISLLLWLRKAVTYALLGRFWILGMVMIILIGLIYSQNRHPKLYRFLLKSWGLYLIAWGLARTLLAVLMQISPISDLHVVQNFNWLGNLYSIGSLMLGFLIFRTDKRSTN